MDAGYDFNLEVKLGQLADVFPLKPAEILRDALEECDGDVEQTIQHLKAKKAQRPLKLKRVVSDSPETPRKQRKVVAARRIHDSDDEDSSHTAPISISSTPAKTKPSTTATGDKDTATVTTKAVSTSAPAAEAVVTVSDSPARGNEENVAAGSANGSTAHVASLHHKPSPGANTALKQKPAAVPESDEEEDNAIGDSDDDYGGDDESTLRAKIVRFFNTHSKLEDVPRLAKSKVKSIEAMRPFKDWDDLRTRVTRLQGVTEQNLWACDELIEEQEAIAAVLAACDNISSRMRKAFGLKATDTTDTVNPMDLLKHVTLMEQPKSLVQGRLKEYQLLGLTWLARLHSANINAVLADEMGLGKTVQAISFLAHLLDNGDTGPHAIFVPPSTRDNWLRELQKWCPSLQVVEYQGSQDERAFIRRDIVLGRMKYNVLLTTYSVCSSGSDDRTFFRKTKFHCVIFDEGHMMKNMKTQRYKELMRVSAKRRVLLTGTPLQNNLLELISLLSFTTPKIFVGDQEAIMRIFTKRKGNIEGIDDLVAHAKRIMSPFVLRRTKDQVLKQLPEKRQEVRLCAMTEQQAQLYRQLDKSCHLDPEQLPDDINMDVDEASTANPLQNSLMQLRKMANHPMLHRTFYDQSKLAEMSKLILKDRKYCDCDPQAVFEDMEVMSDFQLMKLVETCKPLLDRGYGMPRSSMKDSGKVKELLVTLQKKQEENSRVLVFSQFTTMLDILEEILKDEAIRFLRLDGSTPVSERQQLMDQFTNETDILVFLLSTKAGGLGINLTAANVVIIHDIDFNPYNDKQAEDRCHRVGQEKPVDVIRFVSKGTIEEEMQRKAVLKLNLEKEMTSSTLAKTDNNTS